MVKTVLPEIPVFDGLDRHQIEELSSWLQRIEYEPAREIIKEGGPPDGLYVLAKGTVEVVKSTAAVPLIIADLDAPSVFGEMGLLNAEEERSAGVRAQTRVITGFLPAKLFSAKLTEKNLTALQIGVNLGRIACQRLRATTRRLAALSEDFARHALHADSTGVCDKRDSGRRGWLR